MALNKAVKPLKQGGGNEWERIQKKRTLMNQNNREVIKKTVDNNLHCIQILYR